jgi:hypothetical protein
MIGNDKKLELESIEMLKNESIQIGSKLFSDRLPL